MRRLSIFGFSFSVPSPPTVRTVAGSACPDPTTTIPSPAPPAVETVRAGVGAVGRAAPAHPFLRRPDPFGDDCHDGDDDLETFPPSLAELETARVLLAGEGDVRDLADVCLSIARSNAVLREARRQLAAADVLGRIA